MPTRFIHTADWQLGKPFAGIDDQAKRVLVQQERIAVIERIGKAAQEQGAKFILVAGDLFDSSTANKSTVAAACSAIGQLQIPVLVIPGNHDHGGPGCVWEQDFFLREQGTRAPNLRILLKPEPVELESAWIFPCPLLRRAESTDLTAWLRNSDAVSGCGTDKPRIILAHGSTQGFSSQSDEDEAGSAKTNQIDLSELPDGLYDYVALGDWHGTKAINAKAWYSGTPELDRFPKGADHDPGNVLAVVAGRGQAPEITPVRTARFGWFQYAFTFAEDSNLELFKQKLAELIGLRASQDMLQLDLSGSLGVEAAGELEKEIESLQAGLLRVKLANQVSIAPSRDEIERLTLRPDDPVIARVASLLAESSVGEDESSAVAGIALRELFAACKQNS